MLVVDDYHLIHAQPVHRSVEFLLDHLPGSLRLVVATRSDPPLPLARLRARGQSAELRAADLRFTFGEAAQLMAAATGLDLPEDVVVALGERTEGWVAGLQLAALSLQGRSDIEGFVEEFSGSHRYVLDYLTEEVLDRQPEDIRAFLLETSVLDRLSGALCDAVLGRRDSQALLESVERGQPLPAPARRRAPVVALPPLVRRPAAVPAGPRETPAGPSALHQAAAGWYERQGPARRRPRTRVGGRRPGVGGPDRRDPAGATAVAPQRGRDPGPMAHRPLPRGGPRTSPARTGPGDRRGAGRPVGRRRAAAGRVERAFPAADGRATARRSAGTPAS